jgi:hypothetical protein
MVAGYARSLSIAEGLLPRVAISKYRAPWSFVLLTPFVDWKHAACRNWPTGAIRRAGQVPLTESGLPVTCGGA